MKEWPNLGMGGEGAFSTMNFELRDTNDVKLRQSPSIHQPGISTQFLVDTAISCWHARLIIMDV